MAGGPCLRVGLVGVVAPDTVDLARVEAHGDQGPLDASGSEVPGVLRVRSPDAVDLSANNALSEGDTERKLVTPGLDESSSSLVGGRSPEVGDVNPKSALKGPAVGLRRGWRGHRGGGENPETVVEHLAGVEVRAVLPGAAVLACDHAGFPEDTAVEGGYPQEVVLS